MFYQKSFNYRNKQALHKKKGERDLVIKMSYFVKSKFYEIKGSEFSHECLDKCHLVSSDLFYGI